jgi:hypothetical protein
MSSVCFKLYLYFLVGAWVLDLLRLYSSSETISWRLVDFISWQLAVSVFICCWMNSIYVYMFGSLVLCFSVRIFLAKC